jgi:hypothetical protein
MGKSEGGGRERSVGQSVTGMPRPEDKTRSEMTRPNLGHSVTELTRLEAEPGGNGSDGPRLASSGRPIVATKRLGYTRKGDLETPTATESIVRGNGQEKR